MNYTFKNFEIREPTFIPGFEPKDKDYIKYNFDLVKWDDKHKNCYSIANLSWNKKEDSFEFYSIGTRYLEDREDGLEDWLLAWIELKAVEYCFEEG